MNKGYPIRVGITGHRSLTEVEMKYVEKEISNTLAIIKHNIGAKASAQGINHNFFLSGLTSLAEGADRLFASAILNASGSLEVVLPFRKEIYKQDFWGEESEAEFLRFMEHDSYPFIMDNSDTPHKPWAYYQAAKCIVDQCDILLIIWDESPDKNKLAGTAGILEYAKLSKIPSVLIFPRANPVADVDNKKNLNSIDISGYKAFSTEWVPRYNRKAPVTNKLPGIALPENNIQLDELQQSYNLLDELTRRLQNKMQVINRIFSTLIAVNSLLAILVFWAKGMELRAQLLVNSPGGAPAEPLFWQQCFLALLCVEWVFLLALMIVAVFSIQTSKGEDAATVRLWGEKTKAQLYKIFISLNSYERLDVNYGAQLFQNRSMHSRLFMQLSKNARGNFKSAFDFAKRVSLLQEYARNVKSSGKFQRINAGNLAGSSMAIFALVSLGLIFATGLLYDSLQSYQSSGHLSAMHGVLELACLIVPGVCLIVYGFREPGTIGQNTSSNLDEIDRWTEFCQNEEDIDYLFGKIENEQLFKNIANK